MASLHSVIAIGSVATSFYFHGGDALWLSIFWLFVVLPAIGLIIVWLVSKALNKVFNLEESRRSSVIKDSEDGLKQ